MLKPVRLRSSILPGVTGRAVEEDIARYLVPFADPATIPAMNQCVLKVNYRLGNTANLCEWSIKRMKPYIAKALRQ